MNSSVANRVRHFKGVCITYQKKEEKSNRRRQQKKRRKAVDFMKTGAKFELITQTFMYFIEVFHLFAVYFIIIFLIIFHGLDIFQHKIVFCTIQITTSILFHFFLLLLWIICARGTGLGGQISSSLMYLSI